MEIAQMEKTYTSTSLRTSKYEEDVHPFRYALERYRKKKMSQNTWNRVSNLWLNQLNNMWVMSGGGLLQDYLEVSPEAFNYIKKVSNDMDNKREYYFEK